MSPKTASAPSPTQLQRAATWLAVVCFASAAVLFGSSLRSNAAEEDLGAVSMLFATLLMVLGGGITAVGRRRRSSAGDADREDVRPTERPLTRVCRWGSWVVSIAATGFSATATVGDRPDWRHHADSPNGRSLPGDEP